MKPRFSILTLLGVTAYVAVNVAAIARPEAIWHLAGQLAWLGALMYLIVLAAHPSEHCRSAPARAAIACTLLYLLLTFSPVLSTSPHEWFSNWVAGLVAIGDATTAVGSTTVVVTRDSSGSRVASLPRADSDTVQDAIGTLLGEVRIEYDSPNVVDLGPTPQQLADMRTVDQINSIFEMVTLNVSLAFGLFGGSLALWKYRRLERREKAAGG